MKKLVVLFLATMVASSAMAVAEPPEELDGIGVYFDMTADMNCKTVTPGSMFDVYIILTNTTVPAVSFYEFSYLIDGGGAETAVFRIGQEYVPGTGISVTDIGGPCGPGTDAYCGDYIVGMATGIPAAPAVVLHKWTWLYNTPAGVDIYLGPSTQPSGDGMWPTILDDVAKEIISVYPVSGGVDLPVAQVNPAGECVVSVEDSSFGSVKSLYR